MSSRPRHDPLTGGRIAGALSMMQRPGERFPYPPGRICVYCTAPLSRYNPGPDCSRCEPRAALGAAA